MRFCQETEKGGIGGIREIGEIREKKSHCFDSPENMIQTKSRGSTNLINFLTAEYDNGLYVPQLKKAKRVFIIVFTDFLQIEIYNKTQPEEKP
ncbi:MAG TPA: hypothetical protein DCL73_05815, partial [Treponema sp.]|nr:hypothetical protein [Treponema sp.]